MRGEDQKARRIIVQLTDTDCEKLFYQTGRGGVTVGELIQCFIGDLVNGSGTSGSDERMYANKWYDRTWIGYNACYNSSLLQHLLSYGYNRKMVKDFLAAWDELEYSKAHPEKYAEDRAEMEEGEKLWFEEEVEDAVSDWMLGKTSVSHEEIQQCREWLHDSTFDLDFYPGKERFGHEKEPKWLKLSFIVDKYAY